MQKTFPHRRITNVVVRDVTLRSGDDGIAIDLCDGNVDPASGNVKAELDWLGYGSGGNILIDGVTLIGSCNAVRVLVGRDVRAENVTIRNIRGQLSSAAVFLDGGELFDFTTGGIGDVTIEGITAQSVPQLANQADYGYQPCTVQVQAPIRTLRIDHVRRIDGATSYPIIMVRGKEPAGTGGLGVGTVDHLVLRDVSVVQTQKNQAGGNLVQIKDGATIRQADVQVAWSSLQRPGSVFAVAAGGALMSGTASGTIPSGATVYAGPGTLPASGRSSFPAIGITAPAALPASADAAGAIVIAGSSQGAVRVTYATAGATTSAGTATGTSSWSMPLRLDPGVTTVTVTAHADNEHVTAVAIVVTAPDRPAAKPGTTVPAP